MISTVTAAYNIRSFAYVQVAVAVAVLYDHVLTFSSEIDYIWRRSPSLVTALYLLDRYLGDIIVIVGAYLCLTEDASTEVRAWGTLLISWLTQCIMQLRIYAMYRRSRRILVLLVLAFFGEVFAVVVIIWKTIGPTSKFVVTNEAYPGKHLCSFSGINTNFTYLFIPVFCFEILLFSLAIRVSLNNIRDKRRLPGASILCVDSFMSILLRDSILYFFINLAMCAILMGLWRNAAEMHANISIPFVMLVETVIGSRMVINFKEHCNRRFSSEPIMIAGGPGSIRFAGVSLETARLDTIHEELMKGDEMQTIKDEESAEIITFEAL
ncbi:uncharacterized protein EDB91DRAFT_1242004 [Suillus paluster]|uniref:uncharacterized protein n=1 Tax=Suillus paluster TaxID=48578 RepID=UPI001B876484|nr:uncharacterized protein EDB91DRAFT_1242004 [Suillus paluster]KAG1754759.1 hypothetical protein EDB91DRAFT_1242004 [Suillus paluster]